MQPWQEWLRPHRFRGKSSASAHCLRGSIWRNKAPPNADNVAHRSDKAHSKQHQPLVIRKEELELLEHWLLVYFVLHTFRRGHKAEQEQQGSKQRHHPHGDLVSSGNVVLTQGIRHDGNNNGNQECGNLCKKQTVAVCRKTFFRIVSQYPDERDVGDGDGSEHQGHENIGRIRPNEFTRVVKSGVVNVRKTEIPNGTARKRK